MPLDIPDVRILAPEITREGDFMITVESTVEGTTCHKCGCQTDKSYGHDRWITLRHLPILGRKTFIRIRPKRYQCICCDGQPVTTQQGAWYDRRSPHTKAYETALAKLAGAARRVGSPVSQFVGQSGAIAFGVLEAFTRRHLHQIAGRGVKSPVAAVLHSRPGKVCRYAVTGG